ncbi:peptidase M23-like protein [Haloactinopolyspora alba]|uniref:Peptidase M23-like protein n=1 Tax=Haloactinopolyspora alba TaxID=648780 RepID=A0A2P8DVD9_9ACTN|nr:peptidoglycan DD-metalloendopeptidase family protein [Haloactinopolyspora alba]PSL01182.1 peptidase M23-like protein [Haloactinopolyspora alba]
MHRSLTAVASSARRALLVVLVLHLATGATGAASAGVTASGPGVLGRAWVYPVGPPAGPVDLVHDFDPPDDPWLPGHRGVDIAAPVGAEVRAAGSGRVRYAGPLAGRGVVVVDHGTVRTTYEPVAATVTVGQRVHVGAPLGTLAATPGHCAPASCLHWGARERGRYRDPGALVRPAAVRLLPLGERTLSGDPPPPPATGTGAPLDWPVAQPRVTSPYGMRVHPVTGVYKLHDGTDFGAACGTPVRSAAAGQVTDVGMRGAYGLQVTVRHARTAAGELTTSYSHLSRAAVSPGQRLPAGRTVGLAGTTGSSTGCHLHFMVYADAALADPMTFLPGQ